VAKPKILLVDDEEAMRFALGELTQELGFEAIEAATVEEALKRVEEASVVVTDYSLPGKSGLEFLDELRARDPNLPVIFVTAHGSERLAVQALKRGAYDYIAKPFDNEEVVCSIRRAHEACSLRRSSERLALEESAGIRIVGASAALQRVLSAAGRLAEKDVSVLVRGETGTGKELFASLLHARSRRAGGPLVKFNCAAIPHELAEAQLFGYTRGAFTGAANAHRGYFLQAHGGTLLLDEVGELTPPLQAKLLRVLQEREVQPLGSTKVEKVDFRLVTSTHRDLAADAKVGRFREDLYYRIAVVELVVPALRERPDDIALLAREFARKYSERFGLESVIQLAPEFVALLERASWPGNVRQLENAVARCVALATGNVIGPEAFELISSPTVGGSAPPSAPPPGADGPSFREQMEAFERNLLVSALAATQNNQSETARRLGLNRATLYDRLKKYSLLPEQAPKSTPPSS
jgi:two-component system, NtrC family, response regulator AtoC